MKPIRLLIICLAAALAAGVGAGVYYYTRTPHHSSERAVYYDVGGFSGIVVNGLTDEPIRGAHVVARHQTTQDTQEVSTDESGRFALDLEDGTWIFTATKENFLTQGADDVGREMTILDGTKFVNAKLKLWPAAQVHGRVLAGNVGITADIQATYVRDASGAEGFAFEKRSTLEDGTFVIDNAFAGTMNISVAAEGFANVQLKDIVLSAGQSVDLGDIPMVDGVSLYGVIRDAATHRGIQSAEIVVKNNAGRLLESTHADNHGEFRLPALDVKQIEIIVSAEGYHDAVRKMRLEGNANREFNLALTRAWGLSLDVQNQTGREPVKTHVTITDVSTQAVVYDETLANGIYTLDTLKGGPFLIAAESFDKQTRLNMRSTAGEAVHIRLKPFAKIVAEARNSDGSGLSNAQYRYSFKEEPGGDESFMSWQNMVTPDFEIADLPAGFYRVMIKKNGEDKIISSPEFQLRDGDVRSVTLQMTEGGVLKGHVISANEGYNVQATVSIEEINRTAKTDVDGYFTIDKLPETAFTLVVKPNREEEETRFTGIVVKENDTLERDFRVTADRIERREKRRERVREMRERGEFPPPPGDGRPHWGDGKPPWGDGPPPWENGQPPWGDGKPPWGDGPPPWENGQPPWGDGKPPWGDGPPPWENGQPPWGDGKPPWGDGPPPWENGRNDGENRPPWGDGAPPWDNNGNADNPEPATDSAQPPAPNPSRDNVGRRSPKKGK